MSLVNVWSDAPDVPATVCADARLRGSAHRREDRTYGQVGWDLGLQFASLQTLAEGLWGLMLPWWAQSPLHTLCDPDPWWPDRPIRAGEVTRLAINAHGARNTLFMSGMRNEGAALTPETIPRYRGQLNRIGALLAPHSRVYLMGCITVPSGEAHRADLILELSRVWPQASVIGFSTIGYVESGAMQRPGRGCSEPGMRDTDQESSVPRTQQGEVYGSRWGSLSSDYRHGMPWASEYSPHSAVARRGEIVSVGGRLPEPVVPEPDWLAR